MNWAYVVRFPNDGGPLARVYAVKFVDVRKLRVGHLDTNPQFIAVHNARPPVLRRKRGRCFEWDYANELYGTRDFHRLHPTIKLKPGEGPILVDLDDVSTLRTSRHPEDVKADSQKKAAPQDVL